MNDVAAKPTHAAVPFQPAEQQDERNWLPWIVAAVTVVILIVLAFILGGHPSSSSKSLPPAGAAYAGHIVLSNIQMSQATNFAGSQLTYIDGTVTNHGDRTVTDIVVQAMFANDAGEPPQAEQVPFTLIRTRDPYVDTQPVSAAPLPAGASRDFRLIFDDVSPMWNQQLPQLKVISAITK